MDGHWIDLRVWMMTFPELTFEDVEKTVVEVDR